MLVLKFGGTSLGNPDRIKHVAQLVTSVEKPCLVVLSAVAGTTNQLVRISKAYYLNEGKAHALIEDLEKSYHPFLEALFESDELHSKAKTYLNERFAQLRAFLSEGFEAKEEKVILAQGELISTHLMHYYLKEQGYDNALLPSLEIMRTEEGEPDLGFLKEKAGELLKRFPDKEVFITQGYICKNEYGEVDNLRRGGSDYSASLLGAALEAEEIQIWTDIDGMHNNDPRVVKKTFPIRQLSFDEAAELAYFGAKILHPSSVLPAQKHNVPVRLLNTLVPEAEGTLISAQITPRQIKAIAAKDGIIAIKIKSSRMLLAHGFLRRVFEIFEQYRTPIDMITTSEVAISLTIDDGTHLTKILHELREFGFVEVDESQTIICVVGQFLQSDTGIVASVLDSLRGIPVRMVSYGGSKNNVSLLIHEKDKSEALNLLNEALFEEVHQ